VTGQQIVIVACSRDRGVRLLKLSADIDKMGFSERINQDGNGIRSVLTPLTHCSEAHRRWFPRLSASTVRKRWTATSPAISVHSDDFRANQHIWAGAVIYNNTSDRALPACAGTHYESRDLDRIWQGFNPGTPSW
jgi:hypothetical protein